MPSLVSDAPSASCTTVTPMLRAILPRNRADVVPVVSGDTTAMEAAAA